MSNLKGASSLSDLLDLMRELRHPERGCPWDQQQSFKTIAPYTIEEAYEVADAIERDALDELKGELGDLFFRWCSMRKWRARLVPLILTM